MSLFRAPSFPIDKISHFRVRTINPIQIFTCKMHRIRICYKSKNIFTKVSLLNSMPKIEVHIVVLSYGEKNFIKFVTFDAVTDLMFKYTIR